VFEAPEDHVPERALVVRAARRPHWLLRVLIAVPGVALVCGDLGSSATPSSRLVHDCGLPFLLLAVSLPWWRRLPPGPHRTENAVELLAAQLNRAGVMLLMLALFGAIGYRAADLAGWPAGHSVSGILGATAGIFGAVAVFCGRVALRLAPPQARRTERSRELVRALSGRGARGPRLFAFGAGVGFDPGRGASGRPAPIASYPGGARRVDGATLRLRMLLGGVCTLRWSGASLSLTASTTGQRFTVLLAEPADAVPAGHRPAAGEPRAESPQPPPEFTGRGPIALSGRLAELVWCETTTGTIPHVDHGMPGSGEHTAHRSVRRVYLLDDKGFALAVIHGVRTQAGSVNVLAQDLGTAFHAYEVSCRAAVERQIELLMFPRRLDCREFG
jgi:hypothetical protein